MFHFSRVEKQRLRSSLVGNQVPLTSAAASQLLAVSALLDIVGTHASHKSDIECHVTDDIVDVYIVMLMQKINIYLTKLNMYIYIYKGLIKSLKLCRSDTTAQERKRGQHAFLRDTHQRGKMDFLRPHFQSVSSSILNEVTVILTLLKLL